MNKQAREIIENARAAVEQSAGPKMRKCLQPMEDTVSLGITKDPVTNQLMIISTPKFNAMCDFHRGEILEQAAKLLLEMKERGTSGDSIP
ncbi:hypothetical protein [Ruegeria arenilitoris]|uniref:hypothetical protein n=1 Tax=Ruegeria arenilitoris TaxID=1173585 RepID=UPI00147E15A5|nr:hypothetical protein [Ruegeria arenilitoris]